MKTTIGWTGTPYNNKILQGYTFNPWWGCFKVSEGCSRCYAETIASRFNRGIWGKKTPRKFQSDKYWENLRLWDNKAKQAGVRLKVFVASMSDWLEVRDDLVEPRQRLLDEIHKRKNLNFLLLSKRPETLKTGNRKQISSAWGKTAVFGGGNENWLKAPDNVWTGTSIESEKYLGRACDIAESVHAPVHFLSLEPLLEYVDLKPLFARFPRINWWVIVGGESGNKARDFNPSWAMQIIEDCQNYNIPVYIKQMGSVWAKRNSANHNKGEDLREWDHHLRVQEFPQGCDELPESSAWDDTAEKVLSNYRDLWANLAKL